MIFQDSDDNDEVHKLNLDVRELEELEVANR